MKIKNMKIMLVVLSSPFVYNYYSTKKKKEIRKVKKKTTDGIQLMQEISLYFHFYKKRDILLTTAMLKGGKEKK